MPLKYVMDRFPRQEILDLISIKEKHIFLALLQHFLIYLFFFLLR